MTGCEPASLAHTSCRALRKKSLGKSRLRAAGSASDMCDLSMKQTRRTPCESLRLFAQFLPGEVYSVAPLTAALFFRINAPEISTRYRPVTLVFQCKTDSLAARVALAIRASLRGAAHLSQAGMNCA